MILTYFVISISLIFQLSCAQVREQPVTVVASPTSKPANAARPEKQNSDGKLDQDDLTDVTKLVERHRNATKEDKDNASTLFAESKKEFEKGKYTVAGQGFMESASIFPTIEALILAGESIASLNVSDQPANERKKYKLEGFQKALDFFNVARDFAEKTAGSKDLEKYPYLDKDIECIKAYLASGDSRKLCQLVKETLKMNGIE